MALEFSEKRFANNSEKTSGSEDPGYSIRAIDGGLL